MPARRPGTSFSLGSPSWFFTHPAITPDSLHVAYASGDDPVVPSDTNGNSDVFHRDRITGTIELVSVASGGGAANGNSLDPAVSDDGRFIMFTSAANNLGTVPPNSATWNLWVRDRQTAINTFIASDVAAAKISGDGRFVTYLSSEMLYLASRP